MTPIFLTRKNSERSDDAMAEDVLIQFSADKDLKDTCVKIYDSMGIDLRTAFCVFMERTRAANGFPFPLYRLEPEITREEALEAFNELREQAKDVPEMSIDEINAEITAARRERAQCHITQ